LQHQGLETSREWSRRESFEREREREREEEEEGGAAEAID